MRTVFLMTLHLLAAVACSPAVSLPQQTPAPAATPIPPTAQTRATLTASASPTAVFATSQATSVSTPAPSNTPVPTATLPVPGVTAAPGAVKLQFWHSFSTFRGVEIQKLADKFNAANPKLFVMPMFQGSEDALHQKVKGVLGTNAAPELVMGQPGDLADYDGAGGLAALDDYIRDPRDGLTVTQQVEISTTLFFDRIDNRTIGVSNGRSELVLYYNAELLKGAGFDKPPETWEDWNRMCGLASKPPDVYCYAFVPSASALASWIWSRGGQFASADEKRALLEEPAGVEALGWLKQQGDQKWAYLPGSTFGDQKDFAARKVVFNVASTLNLPFYAEAVRTSGSPFAWGVAPMPHSASAKGVVDVFGPSLAIVKTTAEKQKGAWLFLKSLLSREAEIEWAEQTGYIPATKPAQDALAALEADKAVIANPSFGSALAQYKQALSFLPTGRREPQGAAWLGVRAIFNNMLTAVVTGKSSADFRATDPAGASKEGAAKVNQALEDFGR